MASSLDALKNSLDSPPAKEAIASAGVGLGAAYALKRVVGKGIKDRASGYRKSLRLMTTDKQAQIKAVNSEYRESINRISATNKEVLNTEVMRNELSQAEVRNRIKRGALSIAEGQSQIQQLKKELGATTKKFLPLTPEGKAKINQINSQFDESLYNLQVNHGKKVLSHKGPVPLKWKENRLAKLSKLKSPANIPGLINVADSDTKFRSDTDIENSYASDKPTANAVADKQYRSSTNKDTVIRHVNNRISALQNDVIGFEQQLRAAVPGSTEYNTLQTKIREINGDPRNPGGLIKNLQKDIDVVNGLRLDEVDDMVRRKKFNSVSDDPAYKNIYGHIKQSMSDGAAAAVTTADNIKKASVSAVKDSTNALRRDLSGTFTGVKNTVGQSFDDIMDGVEALNLNSKEKAKVLRKQANIFSSGLSSKTKKTVKAAFKKNSGPSKLNPKSWKVFNKGVNESSYIGDEPSLDTNNVAPDVNNDSNTIKDKPVGAATSKNSQTNPIWSKMNLPVKGTSLGGGLTGGLGLAGLLPAVWGLGNRGLEYAKAPSIDKVGNMVGEDATSAWEGAKGILPAVKQGFSNYDKALNGPDGGYDEALGKLMNDAYDTTLVPASKALFNLGMGFGSGTGLIDEKNVAFLDMNDPGFKFEKYTNGYEDTDGGYRGVTDDRVIYNTPNAQDTVNTSANLPLPPGKIIPGSEEYKVPMMEGSTFQSYDNSNGASYDMDAALNNASVRPPGTELDRAFDRYDGKQVANGETNAPIYRTQPPDGVVSYSDSRGGSIEGTMGTAAGAGRVSNPSEYDTPSEAAEAQQYMYAGRNARKHDLQLQQNAREADPLYGMSPKEKMALKIRQIEADKQQVRNIELANQKNAFTAKQDQIKAQADKIKTDKADKVTSRKNEREDKVDRQAFMTMYQDDPEVAARYVGSMKESGDPNSLEARQKEAFENYIINPEANDSRMTFTKGYNNPNRFKSPELGATVSTTTLGRPVWGDAWGPSSTAVDQIMHNRSERNNNRYDRFTANAASRALQDPNRLIPNNQVNQNKYEDDFVTSMDKYRDEVRN